MYNLERVLKEKILHLTDEETSVRLSSDITTKLARTPLIELEVDTKLPYKAAKRKFKKAFLTKLLMLNLGNVSEVARLTGTNRRSIHRLIRAFGINLKKIKRELIRPYDIQASAVNLILGDMLAEYRLTPRVQERLYYSTLPDIMSELPSNKMTFSQAQKEFEKRYFKGVLQDNNHSFSKTARHIRIRQETLMRKLKLLKMA